MSGSTMLVGAGGLLGSALRRAIDRDPEVLLTIPRVSWGDTDKAIADLAAFIDPWLSAPGATRFQVIWAAGAGVTSTSRSVLDDELKVFTTFLETVSEAIASHNLGSRTSFFTASSAGAVYAGGTGAPFDEFSPVASLTGYGDSKLEMESATRDFAARTGASTVIGRISNLYGPDQRLDKAQGFVSHLCKSFLVRKPVSIYVSLDTRRDYIYADDAAVVILQAMDIVEAGPYGGEAIVKNIASQVSTTLGHVIHEAKLVFKRNPQVIIASSPLARGQVRDLRIESVVWPELNAIPRRSLLIGLAQTKAGIERQMHSAKTLQKPAA